MTSAAQKIDVRYVIVCDDIRKEDNGKSILIGVYTEAILVNQSPAKLGLSFRIEVMPPSAGNFVVEFRLIGHPKDVQIFTTKVNLVFPRSELRGVGLTGIPITLQVPSRLSLQWKQDGYEWETIKEIGVKQQSPAWSPALAYKHDELNPRHH